jgi:hypothetical protein
MKRISTEMSNAKLLLYTLLFSRGNRLVISLQNELVLKYIFKKLKNCTLISAAAVAINKHHFRLCIILSF